MTAEMFRDYLVKEILPEVAATQTDNYNPFKHAPISKTVSEEGVVLYSITVRTARSWLHKLGCQYRDSRSGLYFDGHDREDVLLYRVEVYQVSPCVLQAPRLHRHRIDATLEEAVSWGVETQQQRDRGQRDRGEAGRVWVCVNTFKETLAELPGYLRKRVTSKKTYAGERKKSMFCYQDECIYRSNDGERFSWVPPNVHGLKKKGDGAGIMISGTIVDTLGFVAGDQDDIDKAQDLRRERCRISSAKHAAGDTTKPEEYRDIDMLHKDDDGKFWTYYKFEYGKNKEGYWTGAKMVQHIYIWPMFWISSLWYSQSTSLSVFLTGRRVMIASKRGHRASRG